MARERDSTLCRKINDGREQRYARSTIFLMLLRYMYMQADMQVCMRGVKAFVWAR